jgi:uncharacterized protein (PEP-CTERM system associated)
MFFGSMTRSVLGATLLLAAAGPAKAQRWSVEPAISSQLSWTSNSSLGAANAKDDTVLSIRPRMAIRREGARLLVTGDVALSGVAYFNRTQSSTVLPEVDLGSRWEAIDNWLFLEAGVRTVQASNDPFAARTETGSTFNTLTATQTRLSPSIETSLDSRMRYRLRSDNTWTRTASADDNAVVSSDAAGYFGLHQAFIEHDPQPLGWRLEAQRADTRYDAPGSPQLISDLARAVVNVALTEDLSAGLRAGRERNNFSITADGGRNFYGAQAQWQPTQRTLLLADGENRFFGKGWRLGFDHRTPQFAFTVSLLRDVQSAPQSLLDLPATGNVRALLNAMFTTRFPDAAERARVVRQFMADQGLPSSTLGAAKLYSQRVGARNAVALSGFHTRTEDLPGSTFSTIGLPSNNNIQYGTGLTWSHRVAADLNVASTLDWSRIQALEGVASGRSTQQGLRVQVNAQASRQTAGFVGGRYRKLNSNAAVAGREGSLYLGLDHKF